MNSVKAGLLALVAASALSFSPANAQEVGSYTPRTDSSRIEQLLEVHRNRGSMSAKELLARTSHIRQEYESNRHSNHEHSRRVPSQANQDSNSAQPSKGAHSLHASFDKQALKAANVRRHGSRKQADQARVGFPEDQARVVFDRQALKAARMDCASRTKDSTHSDSANSHLSPNGLYSSNQDSSSSSRALPNSGSRSQKLAALAQAYGSGSLSSDPRARYDQIFAITGGYKSDLGPSSRPAPRSHYHPHVTASNSSSGHAPQGSLLAPKADLESKVGVMDRSALHALAIESQPQESQSNDLTQSSQKSQSLNSKPSKKKSTTAHQSKSTSPYSSSLQDYRRSLTPLPPSRAYSPFRLSALASAATSAPSNAPAPQSIEQSANSKPSKKRSAAAHQSKSTSPYSSSHQDYHRALTPLPPSRSYSPSRSSTLRSQVAALIDLSRTGLNRTAPQEYANSVCAIRSRSDQHDKESRAQSTTHQEVKASRKARLVDLVGFNAKAVKQSKKPYCAKTPSQSYPGQSDYSRALTPLPASRPYFSRSALKGLAQEMKSPKQTTKYRNYTNQAPIQSKGRKARSAAGSIDVLLMPADPPAASQADSGSYDIREEVDRARLAISKQRLRVYQRAVTRTFARIDSHHKNDVSSDIVGVMYAANFRYNPYKFESRGSSLSPDYLSARFAANIRAMMDRFIEEGVRGFTDRDHMVYDAATDFLNYSFANCPRLARSYQRRFGPYKAITTGPSVSTFFQMSNSFFVSQQELYADHQSRTDKNDLRAGGMALLTGWW